MEIEIDSRVGKEIKDMQKYLKKKIGADCTESQVIKLALGLAYRVGSEWGYVCEYRHGGIKK